MAITTLPRTGLEQFQGLLGRARGLLGDNISMIPVLGTADALNRIQQSVRSGDYKSAVSAASDVIPVGRVATGLIGAATKGKASGLLGDVMNVARPKTDEATGLPLNPDGTVTVYHHTTAANAAKIAKDKLLRSAGEPDVYFTSRKETDTGYGDTAVPIKINPSKLQVDDEFPDGRMDFRVNVGSKRQLPITLGIQGGTANATDTTALNRYETEFDRKMALAQQRAALPVEQGGLGLAPDNTPMQRAKAIGYDVDNPLYHGTDKSFEAFDLSRLGSQTRIPMGFPQGIYTSPDASVAGRYGSQDGANVLKLLARSINAQTPNVDGTPREVFDRFNAGDIDAVKSNSVTVLKNPSQIRSVNAAFDPFRRNEADLLAFNGTIGSSGLLNINPLLGLLGNQE